MRSHQVVLSLGNWPYQSAPAQYKLSPTSQRIIKEVNIEPISLLPLSFYEFKKQVNLMNNSESQLEDIYNQEIKRRKQKIQIIRIMWEKMKIRRSKSTRNTFTTSPICFPKRSVENIQRNTSRSSQAKNLKKKQKQPSILQIHSPKQSSIYYDDYSTNNRKKTQNKKTEQQQSTRSRRQRIENKKSQQYLMVKRSKNKQRKSTSMAKKLFALSMQQMHRKWSEIDEKHQRQLLQITNILDHEKKRLVKIHQIQKQKLRKQIQNMQTKNLQYKKLKKNFTQY